LSTAYARQESFHLGEARAQDLRPLLRVLYNGL
jgi:hypothetical protein